MTAPKPDVLTKKEFEWLRGLGTSSPAFAVVSRLAARIEKLERVYAAAVNAKIALGKLPFEAKNLTEFSAVDAAYCDLSDAIAACGGKP